jgi:hypothetical protein
MPIIRQWGKLPAKFPVILLAVFQIFVFLYILSKGSCGPDAPGVPFTGFCLAFVGIVSMIPVFVFGIFLITWIIIYLLTKIIFRNNPSRGIAIKNILISLSAAFFFYIQLAIFPNSQ